MNRHDEWVKFRDLNRIAFGETGLPDRVWASRERLIRLLEFGVLDEGDVDIAALTDEQFVRLEALVNKYHPDWQQIDFSALQRERLRRFDRYA